MKKEEYFYAGEKIDPKKVRETGFAIGQNLQKSLTLNETAKTETDLIDLAKELGFIIDISTVISKHWIFTAKDRLLRVITLRKELK